MDLKRIVSFMVLASKILQDLLMAAALQALQGSQKSLQLTETQAGLVSKKLELVRFCQTNDGSQQKSLTNHSLMLSV